MYWLIIGIALLVLGIAFIVIDVNTYADNGLGGIGGGCMFIGILALIILGLSIAGIKADFAAFKTDYEFTKELIEDYERGDDYGNTFDVTEKVIRINEKIAKHRSQWDSGWYNLWRSKELGELEPLKLPRKKTNGGTLQ